MSKFVYLFSEGNADMKMLLGGKGANLSEMTSLGIKVPFGFTVTTEACNKYQEEGQLWPELKEEIRTRMKDVEKELGRKFGDEENPLLFSVRSGAPVSMPGMMDTILNLGLNDISVVAMAKNSGNERWAYDSYRRFITMFSDVAMDLPRAKFDEIMENMKEERGAKLDTDLTAEDLKELCEKFKSLYKELQGEQFPQDVYVQLETAVAAVFRSWQNERAILYRKMNEIPDTLGTAVNVQAMVFGNMGETSGTGVAFSRNPATGEPGVFGEYLMNAQGEDVVAGIRTPAKLATLHEVMPHAYDQFVETSEKLEKHYRDMQDMEFTIQDGELYLLQTRNGKRTAAAAVNCAVDMVEEGLITKEEAILRVEPKSLDQLLHPTFDSKALSSALALTTGLAASPGAASGKICFTAEEAKARKENGEEVLLCRTETSPEDLQGMVSAEGILTSRGGMTSHAAVVARGMGKCCVSGAHEVKIDEKNRVLTIGDKKYGENDILSIDGSTGKVYEGELSRSAASLTGKFATFMTWVNEIKRLEVRTNADTPEDAKQAVEFGAEGIGLCRTEHMFFGGNRIRAMREMILSNTVEQREKALAKILPMQEEDFYQLYKILDGRSVTIRFLDPPLHEFVPKEEAEIESLAKEMGLSVEKIHSVIEGLEEVNPMLGHRGLRLGVTYPEIYKMQGRAVIQAALRAKNDGVPNVHPEIMIPLVGEVKELAYVKRLVVEEIEKTFEEKGQTIDYKIGTMMEIPRACLMASEIAKEAEFFSFGTNDLTQMTFGFSRDDAGKFLSEYLDKGIFEKDPFQVLDQAGVGQLIKLAVENGKKTRPDLHVGICGEHGGDPTTVKFLDGVGLDYVSCSPYRVPIARLAAAQAVVESKKKK